MERLLDALTRIVGEAFAACGYEASLGKVTLSNRPDLCEFQCNGAMGGAKLYHKAPLLIAEAVTEQLNADNKNTPVPVWSRAEAVKPGFINLTLHEAFLAEWMGKMETDEKLGCPMPEKPASIVIDYGGPNVAKPLHIGHLRSAIIGESVKRICRFMGNTVVGDVHLGDWGLQMGLIMASLKESDPSLPYFDPDFTGEYPGEAPFTISELEKIYPEASQRSKKDEAFSLLAHETTLRFQEGDPGLVALWHHIIDVSVADLKKNYDRLNVSFDVWYGESDAQKYIPAMVEKMKADGYAYESQGAIVVDVAEESDPKEIPPCILVKSDGATLYATTDLATIVQRVEEYNPDAIIYLADKRQQMHFTQVFRCARKTHLVDDHVKLTHIGFGTMNGPDGKPYKTRDGGVLRLEYLIEDVEDAVYKRIMENRTMGEEEARGTAAVVGLAALKYGDLSNQASKDYVFDLVRFSSFEGNTGPYILYTIVRIKSILAKYEASGREAVSGKILPAATESEKQLQLCLARFSEAILSAYEELAPHKICQYVYDLSNEFNQFYHETRILDEPDEARRDSLIDLITLTRRALEIGIDLLGFSAPDRM